MNFNWLGTGLFERYDTLFLQLFTEDGTRITKANINVHRVDSKGHYIDDASLSYLGYDAASQSHLIHTYAHHAYIEILVPGCLPILYRYKGAAMAESRILDEELCTAKLTLKAGQPDASGIAISDQYLRHMEDQHVAVTRDSIDYALCEEQEFNLSGRLPVETISFMENGGTEYPKLFNNNPTEKFAQMEVTFSCPKGSVAPTCSMTAREVESGAQHTLRNIDTEIVSSKVFTHFTRDYFFTRYDLTDDLPYNTEVIPPMMPTRHPGRSKTAVSAGAPHPNSISRLVINSPSRPAAPSTSRGSYSNGISNSSTMVWTPIKTKARRKPPATLRRTTPTGTRRQINTMKQKTSLLRAHP